ncbi:hypothetical protein GCM10027511_16100 [Hymenobacter humi]
MRVVKRAIGFLLTSITDTSVPGLAIYDGLSYWFSYLWRRRAAR